VVLRRERGEACLPQAGISLAFLCVLGVSAVKHPARRAVSLLTINFQLVTPPFPGRLHKWHIVTCS